MPTLFEKIFILVFHLLLIPAFINAQEKDEKLAEQRKLEQKITESKTVGEKIENASRLASFHNTRMNIIAADSIVQLMLQWGTNSGNKQDMFAVYRWTAVVYTNSSNPQRALTQYQLALDFAIKERMPNEEIFALSLFGSRYGNMRDYDKANEYYSRIDLNKDGVEDSTRYYYFIRKSNLFFIQGKILDGIKLLFSAKKYAEKTKNSRYIGDASHALGENYSTIREYEKARAYYLTAKKERQKTNDYDRMLNEDFYVASTYWQAKNYPVAEKLFLGLIENADSVKNFAVKYRCAGSLWSMFYEQNELVKVAETAKKFNLLEYDMQRGDSGRVYSMKGVNAEVAANYDSADWYYRKVLDIVDQSSNKISKAVCSYNYSNYLMRYKRYAEALPHMKMSLATYDLLHEITKLPAVYQNLDSIYTALGDYKNALSAHRNYDLYQDSLDNQNKKEDILREEIAAEEESMKKAEQDEIKATERKHDIQYRIIILGGILLLIGLLAIGFFHTPKWLIRGLAFVSFIFIFEFIILILDSKLHHWFHGAPLPILGVKVLIACLLVPLHHFTEHKVTHFLQSKKLHRLKTVFKDPQPGTQQDSGT